MITPHGTIPLTYRYRMGTSYRLTMLSLKMLRERLLALGCQKFDA